MSRPKRVSGTCAGSRLPPGRGWVDPRPAYCGSRSGRRIPCGSRRGISADRDAAAFYHVVRSCSGLGKCRKPTGANGRARYNGFAPRIGADTDSVGAARDLQPQSRAECRDSAGRNTTIRHQRGGLPRVWRCREFLAKAPFASPVVPCPRGAPQPHWSGFSPPVTRGHLRVCQRHSI